MRRLVPLLITILVLAGALPASGAEAQRPETPGAFVSRIVRLIVADDYASAWNHLLASHKRVATKREYIDCELLTPLGWKLRSLRVLRVADRALSVAGEPRRLRAKAVTLRLRIRSASLGTDAFTHTFSAVREGSHWAWILTPDRYELYRSDACA